MPNFKVHLCAAFVIAGLFQQYATASARWIGDSYRVRYEVRATDSAASLSDSGQVGFTNAQDLGFLDSVVSGVFSTPAESATASGLASLSASYPSASQEPTGFHFDSFLTTGRSIGEADGQLIGDGARGFAESIASIDFLIDTPHSYSITGMLTENVQSDRLSVSVTSQSVVELFSLGRSGGAIDGESGDGPVDLDGTLDPGSYRLVVSATSEAEVVDDSTASSNTSFQNVVLNLTEVPEPTTGLMALMGTVLVLRRRQRAEATASKD